MGDEKYDLILLCDVLEHIVECNEFLNKIKNISKRYVLVWSPLELALLRRLLIRLKLRPKIKGGEEHPDKHVRFWNVGETLNILGNHFKILKVGYATGRDMTEKDGLEISKEILPEKKRPVFDFLKKHTPAYFYARLFGGHLMVLCGINNSKNKFLLR